MSDDLTSFQEATVGQLEEIIRKVVREKLTEFATQEQEIFDLNKESPLYEDMENILERKKSGKLRFYTHVETWDGVGLQPEISRRDRAGLLKK